MLNEVETSGAAPEAPPAGEPVLLHRRDGGVVTLTLNRPRQSNALSEELLSALQAELDRLAQDAELRCVVLAASGKAFSAGHDLKQMRRTPEKNYYHDLFSRCGRMMQSIRALPVPVIAEVQGIATAAGCQLVATCDLAVAAKSARFAGLGDQCRPLLLDARRGPDPERSAQGRLRHADDGSVHRCRHGSAPRSRQ